MSRGSTTSIQSAGTHPIHDYPVASGSPTEYQRQWFDNDQAQQQQQHHQQQQQQHQHRFMDAENNGAGGMLMHSAPQVPMHNPREYGIDPALGAAVNHSIAYSQDLSDYRPDTARRSMPAEDFGRSFVTDHEDSPMVEGRSDEQDDVDSQVGVNGAPKKAGKSSAANELEMRQLFQSNRHRSLPEVATELHGNERGPQSERTRQVFAMLWINQVCDKGRGSVPRGRVYANYVSRCATERVTVLNPASFGKLVRVLFPGLKTRRLGVRGESKYHYVNFSLKEDQPNLIENPATQKYQPNKLDTAPSKVAGQESEFEPQPAIDRATFPQASRNMSNMNHGAVAEQPSAITHSRSVYNQPTFHSIQELQHNEKIPQHLQFAPYSDSSREEYEPITLPSIEPYIPKGTDRDSATALTALYRSHCTSLVDAIRFVKQKTFFHLFTSFHGTLTMPVQKLFGHPSIAPWIEECDFAMYQKMISLLSHLTLEVVPQQVLDTLFAISEKLVAHIETSFQGHPAHVIKAKVTPATLFAGLLDRMYRVNLTAHAAANMLAHSPNRDLMYHDWITMVRLRKVAECIPTRAMDDVVNLLLTELRDLLDPASIPWDVESLTPYGDIARTNERQSSVDAENSTENVLDRWVNFLVSLPNKFPYASPNDIIWCVERVGTAVMQDITIKSGASFGSWWVTKCWLDQMINFMAEKGGFMSYKTSKIRRSDPNKQPLQAQVTNMTNVPAFNDMPQDDFTRQSYMQQLSNGNGTANGHSNMMSNSQVDPAAQAAMNAAAGHDDSGIGIRTPDDEFSMAKFNFSDAQMGTPNMDTSMQMGQPS